MVPRELVEKTVTGLGGLDILVINAGRQQYREKTRGSADRRLRQDEKTNPASWIARRLIPHPAGASVITTASIRPIGLHRSCSTMPTKAGIAPRYPRRSRSNIERGIRANVVAPGPVWTARSRAAGGRTKRSRSSGRTATSADRASPSEWRRFCAARFGGGEASSMARSTVSPAARIRLRNSSGRPGMFEGFKLEFIDVGRGGTAPPSWRLRPSSSPPARSSAHPYTCTGSRRFWALITPSSARTCAGFGQSSKPADTPDHAGLVKARKGRRLCAP